MDRKEVASPGVTVFGKITAPAVLDKEENLVPVKHGVGVHLFFKEYYFRARVRIDTNPNPTTKTAFRKKR